ncbi:hypothetical protein A7985_22635 [Pseudoalteromonas luteoviolacea]|uniref:Fatty acid hydroxylase domain-containing protein n=1 Tax=Pseudoalteromonas luteoviolacea TaxID=43657 RepID=A0A1C0TK73_9GAMM|nr:hypothetical protein [Pseudoalteromonas luteoviolacea]MBQ4813826.1 hypothetical protein [Pseudoalteromonas luteoviolacea]OCQ18816.1 hypothetical protein A7985_22635 [Pseudoalteromonas luteoviolacea]
MSNVEVEKLHQLKGEKKVRVAYQKKDFLDYSIMSLICAVLCGYVYGWSSIVALIGYGLCVFMVVSFALRLGVKVVVPLIIRKPSELFYMFANRIKGINAMVYCGFGLLVLENVVIALTPDWPHMTETSRKVAIYLFYIHFSVITVFRTVIFVDHIRKRDKVQNFLMETAWKRRVSTKFKLNLELVHGYFTGVFTHIVTLAPWYFIITHFNFSILFLPLVCYLNLKIAKRVNEYSSYEFYREHWLCHNREFDFVYLHGPHHDAIPSGMIAVGGNGHLEGILRLTIGYPDVYYNPLIVFYQKSLAIIFDIKSHQYIPGVFPVLGKEANHVLQHSIHHMGKLEPYSLAVKIDQPDVSERVKRMAKNSPYSLRNSIFLDEKLNNYKWENSNYRRYISLYDKYSD